MIGRRMAANLLDGTTLKFYQWSSGDVKVRSLHCTFSTTFSTTLSNTYVRAGLCLE